MSNSFAATLKDVMGALQAVSDNLMPVASFATAAAKQVGDNAAVNSDRLTQLSKLSTKYDGGHINRSDLAGYGITDPYLQTLIIPNDGDGLNLDESAVSSYVSSIANQLTTKGNGDNAQANGVSQSLTSLYTGGTSGVANMIQMDSTFSQFPSMAR